MNRLVIPLLAAICLTACSSYTALTSAEERISERILHIRELRATANACWPGFAAPEYDTPLLYYTDSVCYAVNPTTQFRDEFAGRLVYRRAGIEIYKTSRPDSVFFHMETEMNFKDTSAYNGRMPFLRCSSPEITVLTISDVTTDSVWLPMVLHEYTHGFQFRQPGFASTFAREVSNIPENELACLHKRYEWFDTAIKAENTALLTALEAADSQTRNSSIRSFLTLRKERKQRMTALLGDSLVRTEEIYESMEGMARFIEARAGIELKAYKPTDTWLYNTDHSGYFYATGYNLIRLIDKCGIDKSSICTGELLPLETFLTIKENN